MCLAERLSRCSNSSFNQAHSFSLLELQLVGALETVMQQIWAWFVQAGACTSHCNAMRGTDVCQSLGRNCDNGDKESVVAVQSIHWARTMTTYGSLPYAA